MNATEKTTGAVNKLRKAQPYRGPTKSQITPITSLEKMLPETEATPAFPMSVLVKPRLSRITGTRGAAAKVDIKHVKMKSRLSERISYEVVQKKKFS